MEENNDIINLVVFLMSPIVMKIVDDLDLEIVEIKRDEVLPIIMDGPMPF